jgi:hypothetical protein
MPLLYFPRIVGLGFEALGINNLGFRPVCSAPLVVFLASSNGLSSMFSRLRLVGVSGPPLGVPVDRAAGWVFDRRVRGEVVAMTLVDVFFSMYRENALCRKPSIIERNHDVFVCSSGLITRSHNWPNREDKITAELDHGTVACSPHLLPSLGFSILNDTGIAGACVEPKRSGACRVECGPSLIVSSER